jgi:hypothetical protein
LQFVIEILLELGDAPCSVWLLRSTQLSFYPGFGSSFPSSEP